MKHLERALEHRDQWWKYPLTFLIAFPVGNLIGYIPLLGVVFYYYITQGIYPKNDILDLLSQYPISQNSILVLLLFPFVVSAIIMIVMVKRLHKISIKEIINGTKSIRWNKLFFSAVVWTVLMAIPLIYSYWGDKENFVFQFKWDTWLSLLVISILLMSIQTTFEEVIFRGYLAQGIGIWTRSRWLVILIPGIAFGLMHSFNPEVQKFGFWSVMPQYILFGLIFGLISVLDDGIECAIGAHTANNIFISLFVTYDSSALKTPAMFKVIEINPKADLIFIIITFVIFLLILHIAYKWDFSILNRKIKCSEKAED